LQTVSQIIQSFAAFQKIRPTAPSVVPLDDGAPASMPRTVAFPDTTAEDHLMVRRPMGARDRNFNFTLSWWMELVSRRLLLVQLFAPPMQFRHKNVQPIRKRLRQLVLRPYRFA
jgi:hypothetical protein